MNESVAVAKEADAKKASSSTHESDEYIHRVRDDPFQIAGAPLGRGGDRQSDAPGCTV